MAVDDVLPFWRVQSNVSALLWVHMPRLVSNVVGPLQAKRDQEKPFAFFIKKKQKTDQSECEVNGNKASAGMFGLHLTGLR